MNETGGLTLADIQKMIDRRDRIIACQEEIISNDEAIIGNLHRMTRSMHYFYWSAIGIAIVITREIMRG